MKLSEAIRLGSALKPQGFKKFDRELFSCANTAALDAVGQTRGTIYSAFPMTTMPGVVIGFCGAIFMICIAYTCATSAIREYYDWVETVEQQLAAIDNATADPIPEPQEQPKEIPA